MKSHKDRRPGFLQRLVASQVLLGICAAATLAPAMVRAAPIAPPASLVQVPLFLQGPPAPNVFITLDNSGSMAEEVLPDPDDSTGFQRLFPITLRSPYESSGDGQPTTNLSGGNLRFVGFSHHINVARFRSANVNLLYYDPRTRYLPWKTADATGQMFSYPNAGNVALFNPVFPSRGGLDLTTSTVTLTGYTVLENDPAGTGGSASYTARFDAQNASSALTPFALYYKFDPTLCNSATPATDLTCYVRVEIKPGVSSYAIPAGNQRAQGEPGCTKSTPDGAATCDYASEFQNFANWFQYYRARTLLARGAMSNAVADLGPGFRIGFGLLNATNNSTGPADGYSSVAVRLGVRDFTGASRKPFYDLLQNHDVGSSTPSGRALMEVGNYFDWKTGSGNASPTGPWSNDPASGATEFAACRRSYHIYTTDGYWNENAGNLFNNGSGLAGPAMDADTTMWPPAGSDPICRDGAVRAGQFGKCQGVQGTLTGGFRYDPSAAGATSGPAFDQFGKAGSNNLGNPNNRRFVSSESRSLADIAMYFWYRDLQPSMLNLIAPSTADPSFWQNLTTITVALGLTGTKTSLGDTFLTGLDDGAIDPATGRPYAWPTGLNPNGSDPKTLDDLWHAAVNGHGQFLIANNARELSSQLAALLQDIRARSAIGSAAASSTAFLETGTGIFMAEIIQGNWSGNVYRRVIDPATKDFATTFGGVTLPLDANSKPYVWRASDQLAAPGVRPIFTMRTGSLARAPLVDFMPGGTTTGVDGSQMAALAAPPLASATDVINYVRGDRSKEVSFGGTLRDRPRQSGAAGSLNNVFGTFANSSPIYVRDDDFGYDFLPVTTPSSGRESYLAFLRANQGTTATPGRTATIWSSSNEGMMHAFDAITGAELFAYVPRAAIPNLPALVDPKFQHRFIVDGVPALGDAYIVPPGGGTVGWRTVVVSSLGAGGRAVFALDATKPSDLVAAGAGNVYWEVGQESLSAADFDLLGYTLGPAFIARVKDNSVASGGRWVAVFGNGPESGSNRAALFVVDLQDGSAVKVFDTGNGDATNPNGLSTPAPLFDANRQLIGVYAGDLRGNVWKFDLSGANSSAWSVAFNTSPLFTTRSPDNVGPAATLGKPQPIFAKPLLRRHTDGGIMVLFGTGKLISPGDRESEDVQTLYGVWDKPNETGGMTGNFRTAGTLTQQAITAKLTTDGTYLMTNFGVNYAGGQRGWFVDLGVTYSASTSAVNTGSANQVTPRERMLVQPAGIGEGVLAQSFVPSVDSCDLAGVSYLYGLNFMTGGFVGTGSFNNIDRSGAVAMPGALGFLSLFNRSPDGSMSGSRSVSVFQTSLAGDLSFVQFNVPGLGAFRTWRQLLD
jgi:type IV pilus assembly protein PilY1